VDLDAQLIAGALNAEPDRSPSPVLDGVGYQLAGQQDRDIGVDRDVPGADGRPDLAAGLARCGRSGGQPYAVRMQLGRAGRRHGVHRIPLRQEQTHKAGTARRLPGRYAAWAIMLLVIADRRHPSIDGIRMVAAAIRRRG
jgi:hypothetical protein